MYVWRADMHMFTCRIYASHMRQPFGSSILHLSRCQCIFQGGTLPEDVYTHFPVEVPYGDLVARVAWVQLSVFSDLDCVMSRV